MNILMLVAPEEFWETEYFVPHSIFVEKNINVMVATVGNWALGAQGTLIQSDIDISRVNTKDFDGLFVVGGKGMIDFSNNKVAQKIFKEFIEDKKPVALICHGPLLAIKSIPMINKQITGWPEIRSNIEASGAKYTGMPLERDGDIFTAVGPEDAESLANVLIHRLENAPVLTDTLLDEKTAMLKLAWIWRMADSISDEEAERWLKQFEREEFENLEEKQPGKTTVEKPVQPVVPAQKIVFDPARIKQKQIYKSKHQWNIVIDLQPPKTDGSWPEVPEVPPAGFPFTLNELKDGASIRELFRKPETWEKLKEVAANPTKRSTIQSYLVPLMVLVIGKNWWDINKNQKQFGNAPFGLFSQEEYKRLKEGKLPLEETDEGRAIISMINWHVPKILQFYLATGKIEESRLDGYIYKSLNTRIMKDVGKRYGFEEQQKPICAYCRFKRVIETTPPILSEIGIHKVQEKGKRRAIHIYKCPTCEEVIKEKEQTLKVEEQNLHNFQESLNSMESSIQDVRNELNKNPDNRELKDRLINYESMLTNYRLQAKDSLETWRDLHNEVRNRKNMQHVSTTHIGCINETCPGYAIPITFVDWDKPFWNTDDGKKAREELLKTYNIGQPEELKTEQKAEDVANVQQKRDLHTPPTWMWHVPFYCPFDGSHFTPKEAFGKGRPGLDGTRMGGLFVTYPRTLIWGKPLSLEEQNMTGGEAKHQRLEEIRSLTGITTTTESGSFLNDQEQKLEDKQMSEILRQVLVYQNKTRRVKKSKKMGSLIDTLYDALLDFSYIHPLHLVRYFTNRKPLGVKEVVTDDGKIERHLATLPSGTAQQVESPVVQIWFTKILKQYGEQKGMSILQKEKESGGYLTNYERDKIWPDSFFLTKIKSGSNGRLYATCELKSTSKMRGPGYGIQPYMALVRDIWAYDGDITQEQKEISIDKTTGSQLVVGKTGRRFEMESHDPRQIYFDTSTNFKEGDSIIVRALFMPWHTAWRALRDIKDIRQASQQYMENAPSYIGSLRMWNAIKDGDKDTIINSIVKKLKSKKISEELKQKYDKILQELKNKTEPLSEREVQLLEALMGETDQEAADMTQDAKDPLSTYKGKREFDKTPEPEGKEEKGQNKHRFVIQLHHALKAHDHYDLRLENEEGTLSSWSIPKHHLPKGKEKLLAIKTEDHPIKYLKFKGSIPVGSYGAGEMEIHDSGTYEEIEFGKTKIVFKLNGKKEKGTYKLFRAGKDKNWLIMEDDSIIETASLRFSKRAVLERLPIHHDPAMWTSEQLVDAVQQPELFGNDKERYQLAVEQLAKRGLAKKIEQKDIENWLEHGKFMLLWSGSPLALYKTKEQAERAKHLLVSDFTEKAQFPPFTQAGQIGWKSNIINEINHAVGRNFDNFFDNFDVWHPIVWHPIDNQSRKEVEGRLLNPKTNEKDRKEYAESALNIVKLPQTANIPDKDYSVSDRPNEADSVHASDYLFSDSNDNESIDKILIESQGNESKGRDKFIEQAVKTVKKRIDAQRAGFNPEKLADDDALELALISSEDTDI